MWRHRAHKVYRVHVPHYRGGRSLQEVSMPQSCARSRPSDLPSDAFRIQRLGFREWRKPLFSFWLLCVETVALLLSSCHWGQAECQALSHTERPSCSHVAPMEMSLLCATTDNTCHIELYYLDIMGHADKQRPASSQGPARPLSKGESPLKSSLEMAINTEFCTQTWRMECRRSWFAAMLRAPVRDWAGVLLWMGGVRGDIRLGRSMRQLKGTAAEHGKRCCSGRDKSVDSTLMVIIS